MLYFSRYKIFILTFVLLGMVLGLKPAAVIGAQNNLNLGNNNVGVGADTQSLGSQYGASLGGNTVQNNSGSGTNLGNNQVGVSQDTQNLAGQYGVPIGGKTDMAPSPGQETNGAEAKKLGVIGSVVKWVLKMFIGLMGGMVDWLLSLSEELANMEALRAAWRVFLNLADLGLILSLIVIAFATIINYESYALKNTLWKLIVAALLVNFSFTIGISIIQLSNGVSRFLLDNITKGEGGLSEGIGQMMDINEIERYSIPNNTDSNNNQGAANSDNGWLYYAAHPGEFLQDTLSAAFQMIVNAAFLIFFLIIIFLIFATLAIMMLVRTINLAVLLIWSPFAWFSWILPYTKKHWDDWWDGMLKWSIFLPTALLWIYVAQLVSMSPVLKDTTRDANAQRTFTSLAKGAFFGTDFFSHAVKLVIVGGLLVSGLLISYNVSGYGAALAIERTKAMKEGTKKWATRRGKGTAAAIIAPPHKNDDGELVRGGIGKLLGRVKFTNKAYEKVMGDWRQGVHDKLKDNKLTGSMAAGAERWSREYREGKGMFVSVLGTGGLMNFIGEAKKKRKEEEDKIRGKIRDANRDIKDHREMIESARKSLEQETNDEEKNKLQSQIDNWERLLKDAQKRRNDASNDLGHLLAKKAEKQKSAEKKGGELGEKYVPLAETAAADAVRKAVERDKNTNQPKS